MMSKEQKNNEFVEAVPGPAFTISREEYEKLLNSNKTKQNRELLEKYRKFFSKISKKENKGDKMEKEFCYVMIKPGVANNKGVIKVIRDRLIAAGLTIGEEGYVLYDVESAQEHYAEHIGKKFYQELEDYITSGKAYGMIVYGKDAIKIVRSLVQKDKAAGLQPGDIRFDIPKMFGIPMDLTKNIIHASDCIESAKKESKIFKRLRHKSATNFNDQERE